MIKFYDQILWSVVDYDHDQQFIKHTYTNHIDLNSENHIFWFVDDLNWRALIQLTELIFWSFVDQSTVFSWFFELVIPQKMSHSKSEPWESPWE